MLQKSATQNGKAGKTGMYQKQIRAIIACTTLILLLIVGVSVALFITSQKYYEENGERYPIEKENGVYVLFDPDGNRCEMTDDNKYYRTNSGSLIYLDGKTGEYEIYAAVDTEESEEIGNVVTGGILMYPYIERADIQAIQVYNPSGGYTVYRNAEDQLSIKDAPLAEMDQTLLSHLVTTAGYTYSIMKIKDPILDDQGDFSEYGLSDSETYWVLTTTENEVYKVKVGDALPTKGGYYVQYIRCSDPVLNADGTVKSMKEDPRMSVYIISNDVEQAITQPIEALVTNRLAYPTTLTTYFDVERFTLLRNDKITMAFSFIPLEERVFNERANDPYKIELRDLKGYVLSSTQADIALNSLYQTTFLGCVKLCPSEEDLVKYGIYKNPVLAFEDKVGKESVFYFVKKNEETGKYALYDEKDALCATNEAGNYLTAAGTEVVFNHETAEKPEGEAWFYSYSTPYTIFYEQDIETSESGAQSTIEQYLLFSSTVYSEELKARVRYAYSELYDMIVAVAAYDFEWMEWNLIDWIEPSFFSVNISYVHDIKVENNAGESHEFVLNNTASAQGNAEQIKETKYTDSKGNAFHLRRVDGKWTLVKKTGTSYTVSGTETMRVMGSRDKNNELKMKLYLSYFGDHDSSKTAEYDSGWFLGDMYLTVAGDLIVVNLDSDEGEWYLISFTSGSADLSVLGDGKAVDVKLFRKFFQTILYASISGEFELTEEQLKEEHRFQMRLTVHSSEQNFVCEFYRATGRKSYIRISGDGGETFTGGMYVLSDRVEKIFNDALRVLNGEEIDATGKN